MGGVRWCLLALLWGGAATASAEDPTEAAREERTAFTLDLGFGWAAVRGNDVQVGSRVDLVSGESRNQATLTPLVTEMQSDYSPFARAAYEGETWGIQGEYWQLETDGSVEGAFSSPLPEPEEDLEIWDGWLSRSAEVRYGAANDLTIRSIRVDLTRNLGREWTVAVGFHAAELENTRAENVERDLSLPFVAAQELLEARSRVTGWLYGPSVGLRGSLSLGEVSRLDLSLAQSVLFSGLDQEASWSGTSTLSYATDLDVDSTFSSRAALPVTDVRAGLTFDLTGNVSLGAFALLSVWHEVPLAPAFSIARVKWEQPRSTLVFASAGPVVRIGF